MHILKKEKKKILRAHFPLYVTNNFNQAHN